MARLVTHDGHVISLWASRKKNKTKKKIWNFHCVALQQVRGKECFEKDADIKKSVTYPFEVIQYVEKNLYLKCKILFKIEKVS